MRRPKISLKKYFYFTLICALLLIFGFNLKEYEIWKTKSAARITQQHQQQQRQQHAAAMSLQQTNDDADDGGDDVDDDDDISAGQPKNNVKQIGLPTTLKNDLQQQQHHQQQQRRNDDSVGNEDDETNALLGIEKSAGEGAIAAAFAAGAPSGVVLTPTAKPWFFRNGDYYPRPAQTYRTRKERKRHAAKLFPHQDPHSDRIVRQLMYVPHNYDEIRESGKLKTILLYNGLGPWNVKRGRDVFLRSKCPVDTCELTANRNLASSADMILYKDHFIPAGVRKSSNHKQVTMLYYLECPYHTQNVKVPDGLNWTATYRRDSDIVTPYEKWQYYDTKIRQAEQDHNYAANKTKKVAWFVSNCGARNGRLQYAHDLQKHIEVDIFGACGNYKCSRSTADKCFEILDRDYKFYLAFENSNCKDYITEKFFVNALNRNILPIVMGARPEDYEVSAPHRSYIHVDEFASPKELAEYLHILDQDDELYNSYFKWKGTGEFINTFYWCRVCAALHNEEALRKPRWYRDLNDWWRGTGVCTNGSWRNYKARKDVITDD